MELTSNLYFYKEYLNSNILLIDLEYINLNIEFKQDHISKWVVFTLQFYKKECLIY